MFLSSGYFSISVGGACTLLPVIMAFNSSAFTPALLSKWLLVITYVVWARSATLSILSFQSC